MALRLRMTMMLPLLCALLLSGCGSQGIAVVDGLSTAQTVSDGMGELPEEYGYENLPEEGSPRRLPEPANGETVLSTEADPGKIQALYLWEEGNVPAQTELSPDYHGSFDPWDFRPYLTAIPVRPGVEPKGAVVLMAGGSYAFRSNYTDTLPAADALRERGYVTFIVDYRLLPYIQGEGALDVARAVRYARRSAPVYGYDPEAICLLGFSAGGSQAGEFLMHYDEDVSPTVLDPDYVPDELDALPARATADAMVYAFYGWLGQANLDPALLSEGDLPPTFYVYGTEDGYFPFFEQQYGIVESMGIPTDRIVLEGQPHAFGVKGGWIKPFDLWLKGIWAERDIPMPGMSADSATG